MDNAATTPVLPEVRDIMIKVMEEDFGNPSSKHTKGMIAERYITEAKETIALYQKYGWDKLPICMAKTQNSLSDDAKLVGRPVDFTIYEIRSCY